MNKTPYPVGTVCRVRSKEDMIAEFGNLSNVPFSFVSDMLYMQGKTFTVKRWTERRDIRVPTIQYWSSEGIECGWSISHEMLEPVVSDDDDDMTVDIDLHSLLFK